METSQAFKIGIVLNGYILDESPILYSISKGLIESGYRVRVYINQYHSEKNTYEKIGAEVFAYNKLREHDNKALAFDVGEPEPFSQLGGLFLKGGLLKSFPGIQKMLIIAFSVLPLFAKEKIVSILPYVNKYCRRTRSYTKYLSKQNIEENDLLIITEPEALIAYHFLRSSRPFIYLCLELNNLSFEKKRPINVYKKKLEKKYIRRARFTIIQDTKREKIFREDNDIPEFHKIIHLPVTIKGDVNHQKSDYFRQQFGISTHKSIVLYAGSIMPWACLEEIVDSVKTWDERFVLVIHGGRYDQNYLDKLLERSRDSDRIFFSTEWVEYSELDSIISSADIGISAYVDNTLNNQLTIFASGKLAAYLKSGLPVITRDFEGMGEFYQQTGCGACFSDFDQIGKTLFKIDNHYEMYREAAFKTFLSHFSFDNNFEKILKHIEKIKNE